MRKGARLTFSNAAPGLDPVTAGRLFDRFYTVGGGPKLHGAGAFHRQGADPAHGRLHRRGASRRHAGPCGWSSRRKNRIENEKRPRWPYWLAGRVSVRAAGLCGSRQIPGGVSLLASGLGKGQSFVEHQVVLLVGLRGGALLLLLQKAEKTPGCNPWLCGAASCSAGTTRPPVDRLGSSGPPRWFPHIVGHAAFLHLKTAGLKPQKGIGRPRLMVQRQAQEPGLRNSVPPTSTAYWRCCGREGRPGHSRAGEPLGDGAASKSSPHILGHFLVGRVPGGEALIQFPGSRTFPAALPHAHGRDVLQEQAAHPIGRGEASGLRQAPHPGKGPLPHGFRGQEQRRELLRWRCAGCKISRYHSRFPDTNTAFSRLPAFPGPPG